MPDYPNKELLYERLTLAIRERENSFGFAYFGAIKVFRKTVDVRKKMSRKIEKKYILLKEFAYDPPNHPQTPLGDVIYNAYRTELKMLLVKNKRSLEIIPRYINPKLEGLKRRNGKKVWKKRENWNINECKKEKNFKKSIKLIDIVINEFIQH